MWPWKKKQKIQIKSALRFMKSIDDLKENHFKNGIGKETITELMWI